MLGTRIIKYGEIQYVDTTFFSFRQFSAISPIELHYIYISVTSTWMTMLRMFICPKTHSLSKPFTGLEVLLQNMGFRQSRHLLKS